MKISHDETSSLRAPVIEVPAHRNILQYTAEHILNTSGDASPDFSDLSVLLPHSHASEQFNLALSRSLDSSTSAIIPPWSGTLKSWVKQFVDNEHPDHQIISEQSRQLLFIEALQLHPGLFKEENKWQVTQALLGLFDELSLNQQNLFASEEEWQLQLQQAYGIEHPHEHLLYESKLVHTLWHAWKKQLSENKLYDETGDYLSRLSNACTVIDEQQFFLVIGFSSYTKTEQSFIQNLVGRKQCSIIAVTDTIETTSSEHTVFSDFINETFSYRTGSIKSRALRYRNQPPEKSSTDMLFSTYLASNEEEQIRAIDYHVRLNTLEGKRIAIISEDRKLSRRLRALLERAGIQLQDNAGWSLATTQAASIIERWLQCIEEDFSAYPLLDFLKSPYISITDHSGTATENFRKNIYRFEHDLILHENVSSNIDNYKRKLSERLKRLDHWPENTYNELIATLDFIAETAEPLVSFYKRKKNIPLSVFLKTLLSSLQRSGIIRNYQADDAGMVLLKTFDELTQSTELSDPALSWQDCRLWLGLALESQHFTPLANNSNAQLMTLEQASYLNFDCIIIAATESQHFPGSAKNHPFFNQSVRASLGLATWDEQCRQRHELFNRTLLSAPDILLTACDEENGEEKPVSPWLELLINFHQLAYNRKPENSRLHQLVRSNSEVFNCDDKSLPEQSSVPAPVIPTDLVPEKVSASAYQRIIDCPYQYFSADGLKLKPLEELSDELKKSGYGERIHLILQCFHSGHKVHGKAFGVLTDKNIEQANRYLSSLSEKIFLHDLDDNVLHRSWLYRWQKHIPSYISWQLKHQQDWYFFLSENNLETTLDESIDIHGRLDRIDKNRKDDTHAIIDYKTGRTARQEDIDAGENVQLSTYALLDNEASEVSYLSVDSSSQKVETRSSLSGDDLGKNREENKNRLITLFKQMKQNHPLHAWGDATVCRYCNFSGLCRKTEWENQGSSG